MGLGGQRLIATGQQPSVVLPAFADPVVFVRTFWPQFTLYGKQREILYSLRDNYETIVPAGNELGKDFIAGLAVLWFFRSRTPCRIMTTSPESTQLEDVLWGEIRRFISEAKRSLEIEHTHLHLYQIDPHGNRVPKTEVVGRVVKKGESMLGRHAERTEQGEPTTLLVVDEASGCENDPYEKADTWTHRKLVIGNPYPCTNFFFNGTKEGDLPTKRPYYEKLYRKVIKIRAQDSPNVELAEAQIAKGKQPTMETLIPGVVSYPDYLQRRESWEPSRQCVGLDATFYEGESVKLYPPTWLNHAEELYSSLTVTDRVAKGIGIDPAEGGDSTCFAAVDQYGLIELVAVKTPDTSVIKARTLAFMRKHGLNPRQPLNCEKVVFDRGGGGKEHADYLRMEGFPVRTVGFGEAPTPEPQPGQNSVDDQRKQREDRYAYKNRRAELFGRLRRRLDPNHPETMFSFSPNETELRNQLSVFPLVWDDEGRMMLPPKNKKPGSRAVTLVEMVGHSPDEADAVALAVYAMEVSNRNLVVSAF